MAYFVRPIPNPPADDLFHIPSYFFFKTAMMMANARLMISLFMALSPFRSVWCTHLLSSFRIISISLMISSILPPFLLPVPQPNRLFRASPAKQLPENNDYD